MCCKMSGVLLNSLLMLGGLGLTQNQFYFKFDHENADSRPGAKLSDGAKLTKHQQTVWNYLNFLIQCL